MTGFKEFAAAVAFMTDLLKNMSEIFQKLQERSKQVISTDTHQKCYKQKNMLYKQKIYSAAAIHKQEIRLAAAMYAGIPP